MTHTLSTTVWMAGEMVRPKLDITKIPGLSVQKLHGEHYNVLRV